MTPVAPARAVRMNFPASLSDFFKSPKWGMNLLLCAVCNLIPVVGPMVLGGWLITGFWARDVRDPAKFPDFDFSQFGKYLERGLWPFLVGVVASLVVMPFFMAIMFALMGGFFLLMGQGLEKEPDIFSILLILGFFGCYILMFLVMILLQIPLRLRATITQDFGASFNWGFYKRFYSLVWPEVLQAGAFSVFVGVALMIAGVVACYVGMFFTMPLSFYVWHHLERQLYDVYLSRGGDPVPRSVKLQDIPPSLPVPPPGL